MYRCTVAGKQRHFNIPGLDIEELIFQIIRLTLYLLLKYTYSINKVHIGSKYMKTRFELIILE